LTLRRTPESHEVLAALGPSMVAGSVLSLSDRLRMRVESRWRDFAVEAAGTSVGVRSHIAEHAVEAPPGTTLRGTPISCHSPSGRS
jgi:hypothetical protein